MNIDVNWQWLLTKAYITLNFWIYIHHCSPVWMALTWRAILYELLIDQKTLPILTQILPSLLLSGTWNMWGTFSSGTCWVFAARRWRTWWWCWFVHSTHKNMGQLKQYWSPKKMCGDNLSLSGVAVTAHRLPLTLLLYHVWSRTQERNGRKFSIDYSPKL